MTRKRHIFDTQPTVVIPPVVGAPTVTFQQFSLIAFVGDDVEMSIFWESISAGLATLTTTVPTLSNVSDLTLASGNATWSKTNVQLSDSGQIQVDISDAGGAALDTFTLAVHALPTISVATTPDLDVFTGDTGTNAITWGDADASAQKPIASITTNYGSVDQISDQTQTTGTARWILPNAQVNDSHIVTIWITDFDGYQTSTQFQFNVAPAAGGAPLVAVSPFPQELPIGSEAILNFQVQDAETSLAKPMALFQVLDGATDVSADGVFSPLPAAVTVPTQVSIGWSTTSSNLVDDGTIYTVKVTDDDTNEAEGATELVFQTVDPLKTLAGHPVQRQSGWSASVAPIAATSNDPLRQLTGHPNPGVSIWTNPSNVTWANGGVLIDAEVGKMSTSMTASITTAGTYTARVRIDLPDFNTSVRVRLIHNGTSYRNDYSHTGPTNLPAGVQLNFETFPVVLVAGDTLTLELWTEHYNGSTIIVNPSDAQKAFLSIMDLGTSSASEFPAGGGTHLYHWEMDQSSGVFTGPLKATYDAERNALPKDGPSGRPEGDQSKGPSTGIGQIIFPINFEIPRAYADGSLECFKESDWHDRHTMLRANMPGGSSTYVKSSTYLRNGQEYEVETVFDVAGRVNAIGEGRNVTWAIISQAHPGSFPNGWSGNPPLLFQLDDSESQRVWKVHARGCTNPDPTAVNNYTDFFSADVANFWSGRHVCIMRYKQDWTGGPGSYLKVWWDGKLVVDEAPIPIGLNFSAFGFGDASQQYTYGHYSGLSGDPPNARPTIKLLKFSIRGL